MVFNWFRRKFDKSDASSEPELDSEQILESISEDVAESTPEIETVEQPTEVATDYLEWGKSCL